MSTTIAEQVTQHNQAAATQLPAEVGRVFADDAAHGPAHAPAEGVVKAGDHLDAFTLPDQTGAPVSLAELTADGPAVLVFYRGGWCPYCNIALRTYEQELLPQLARFGARLVAISPERPDASLSTREKAELTFSVLSDAGSGLAGRLGLTYEPSGELLETQRGLGLDIRAARADETTVGGGLRRLRGLGFRPRRPASRHRPERHRLPRDGSR